LRHLKLHGKIVIADGKKAIVGSINLSPGSFDSRRELAIETKSKQVLKRLVQVSRRDWKHSRKLDLSDAGVLADLEKHGSKGADVLVLGHTK
jgi:phosphatidylserine/phosphatidylglycerophosphate/cardiolipin synthase-like enzyme